MGEVCKEYRSEEARVHRDDLVTAWIVVHAGNQTPRSVRLEISIGDDSRCKEACPVRKKLWQPVVGCNKKNEQDERLAVAMKSGHRLPISQAPKAIFFDVGSKRAKY